MERVKAAFVTPGSFPVPSPHSSSVEHVVAELSGRLAGQADCTVLGIQAKGYPAYEWREGVRYIRPSGRKGYLGAVIRELKNGGYQIIQVENRPRLAQSLKKAFLGKPVWLSLHSLTFVHPRRISSRELEAVFRRVDRIVANSHFLQEELAKRVPSCRSKIVVNHLGVRTDQFQPRWTEEGERLRTAKLQEIGLAGKKVVLYVGRLVELKGVHHLLRAFAQVVEREPEAVLVVVGSAFYGSKRLTPYVRRLHLLGNKLPANVLFVPYVPHDRIQDWFRLADVAVVPSPRKEAFGLVNIEAMATGVPVVAAEAGGLKEIVVHGTTGFLAPVSRLEETIAGHLLALLGDEPLRRALGQAGAARVQEHFTWEAAAGRWLELVRSSGI
ncbi:glycosyltransferase family 4 protein [Gorillibacterium sp. sgz5001074]|uniref:glycosyltransferase family 4 protein n=1 Tax=Gorillibacterium sp. sgz5001074 TaxID=3446695 RepID=UPI003F66DED2